MKAFWDSWQKEVQYRMSSTIGSLRMRHKITTWATQFDSLACQRSWERKLATVEVSMRCCFLVISESMTVQIVLFVGHIYETRERSKTFFFKSSTTWEEIKLVSNHKFSKINPRA